MNFKLKLFKGKTVKTRTKKIKIKIEQNLEGPKAAKESLY